MFSPPPHPEAVRRRLRQRISRLRLRMDRRLSPAISTGSWVLSLRRPLATLPAWLWAVAGGVLLVGYGTGRARRAARRTAWPGPLRWLQHLLIGRGTDETAVDGED